MARRKPKTVRYRRKREGKTDYKKRLSLLFSRKPRLVVRFTNQRIIAQIIEFTAQGDRILMGLDSSALKKVGWDYSNKNFPAAYLTGLLLGKTALQNGCKEAVLDTGLASVLKQSRIFAFLKGTLDAGLQIPHGGKDIFPSEETIAGRKIKEYATKLKEKEDEYQQKFGKYLKNKVQPENIERNFAEVRKKIMGA